MLDVSEEFHAAITAQSRRTLLRAAIDLISPGWSPGAITSSGRAVASPASQLVNKETKLGTPLAYNEWNYLLLDRPWIPYSTATPPGEVGFIFGSGNMSSAPEEEVLADENGNAITLGGYEIMVGSTGGDVGDAWVQLALNNVNILQSYAIYWPDDEISGWGVDFTVEIYQSGNVYYTKTVTGNTEKVFVDKGFTVYSPDAIKLTITKWSLPYRRPRVVELWPGYHEIWDGDMLASFDVSVQADFTGLSLPYGTCDLSMDNSSKLFEPTSKNGLFRSIEERQGVEIAIGANDSELVPVGVFFQASGGWRTGANALTMAWHLVDIVGLLAEREYIIPDAGLPTTLETWVASLVAQLGDEFGSLYTVDSDIASTSLTTTADRIKGQRCGQILLWLCQAVQAYPRADYQGRLRVGALGGDGPELTLDNLASYPTIRANQDMARIDFTLYDGTSFSVPGNSSSSQNTASINNPFLTTVTQAQAVATWILRHYGGNVVEATGRGNPAGELGDLSVVDMGIGSPLSGRLTYQTFTISDGVMKNCKTRLLLAEGIGNYDTSILITESGTFAVPDDMEVDEDNVGTLYIILVGGGQAGGNGRQGKDESMLSKETTGDSGNNGDGGRVWFGTQNVQLGQSYSVTVGAGGKHSTANMTRTSSISAVNGTASRFGNLSSAAGVIYAGGYTDLMSSALLARPAQTAPIPNSGDGGKGGRGGRGSTGYLDGYIDGPYADQGIGTIVGEWVLNNDGTDPERGTDGADGCVIVYYKRVV